MKNDQLRTDDVRGLSRHRRHIIASDRAKTKSSYRSFPMSETVREKLLAWREVQKKNRKICGNCYNMKDIDYVFTDEMGNRFKPRYIEDAFQKILERNGLRKIRFHDLRHTCASLMHQGALAQGSAGLFRAFHRERNFEYLYPFGLKQQGKRCKSHGKCRKITRKGANRERVGELKKPYATRFFRGSGENLRALSKAKISDK